MSPALVTVTWSPTLTWTLITPEYSPVPMSLIDYEIQLFIEMGFLTQYSDGLLLMISLS